MRDPCATREQIECGDFVRQKLGDFLAAWYELVGDLSIKTKDIIRKVEGSENEFLKEHFKDFEKKDGKVCSIKLGVHLKKISKRIENGFRLENSGKSQGFDLWRVRKIVLK